MNPRPLLWGSLAMVTSLSVAQAPPVGPGYDEWKAQTVPNVPVARDGALPGNNGELRGGTICDCWHEPDASYTTIDNDSEWDASGFNNGDDGSYGPINIPFQFYLYGQYWNTFYININGNVSFGNYYSTFSAQGFPVSGFTMVAPFWADVDLRGICSNCNTVKYKVTPTAVYVTWDRVGYYSQQTDKLNTFQLIFTDGTDPVIPNGANVSFCYRDMQWTTGSASNGTGGFGGFPANVGANQGNGVDYLQFGRFDHAGTDYDGPYGANDGVSFLDFQNFTFLTDVTTGNIPPVINGQSVCDTVVLCSGEPHILDLSFLSPEPSQTTTPDASSDLAGFSVQSISAGQTGDISVLVQPTIADSGYHWIHFTGSDNGTPPLTTEVDIVVHVLPSSWTTPGSLTLCGNGLPVALENGLGLPLPTGGDWYYPNGTPNDGTIDPQADPMGVYYYVVDTGLTCPVIAPVNIITYAMVTDSLVSGAQCNGDSTGSITIISTGNGGPWNYTWHDASDQVVRYTANSVGDIFNGPAGTYTIIVAEGINGNGCLDSLTVEIPEPDPVEVISISNDTTICNSGMSTLIAWAQGGTGSLSGHWNDGFTGWAHSVSPLDTTTYSIWATDANGCMSDTLSATVNVLEPINFELVDTTITCPDVDVILAPLNITGGDGAYLFDWGAGFVSAPGTTLNTTTSQTYCLTVTDGCETPDLTLCGWLHVKPIPELELTADTVLGCEPFMVHFSVLDTTGGATVDWNFGDGFVHPGPPAVVAHTYPDPGTYDVHVTAHWPNGCDDDSTYADLITVAAVPVADFIWEKNPTDIFQPLIEFHQTASPSAVSWIWEFNGDDTLHGADVSYLFPSDIGRTYPVQLVVANYLGCADTVVHQVEVADILLVYVPTAFTPDGDGVNDELMVSGNDISATDFSFMIFDRWGEKIHETTDRHDRWNGTFGGEVVAAGVYPWILKVRSSYTGIAKEYMGAVSIMH